MIYTTLNKIRQQSPCLGGWERLLKGFGKVKPDDEPLPFSKIIKLNGLDDALWCARSAPEYNREWQHYAVWCARQVQHLMTDQRSIAALDVAEKYANGEASREELIAASYAAHSAAQATIRRVASDAPWVAAEAAARDAAIAAAESATIRAVTDAPWAAANAAARAAAVPAAVNAAQESQFLKLVATGCM